MKLGNPKTNADVQMSEAFVTSVFLALSGGFQDAYTYFTREEVFSNAQTGNIVLMSTHLMMGEWLDVLRYLLPLLAFASGVFFAEKIHVIFKYGNRTCGTCRHVIRSCQYHGRAVIHFRQTGSYDTDHAFVPFFVVEHNRAAVG